MKLRFDHPAWRRLAPPLVARLVKGWYKTFTIDLTAEAATLKLMEKGGPILITTWHCHLLIPLVYFATAYPDIPQPVLMASPSRDGEFIADITRSLGFMVSPGSRRKGGAQALLRMAPYFQQGHSGGVVADGSRGPARIAQKGVLFLAREGRVPIVPLAVAARRKLTFNTWDRFEMPLPCTRVTLLAGAPLYVGPKDRGPALEALREELTDHLNRLFELSQSYY